MDSYLNAERVKKSISAFKQFIEKQENPKKKQSLVQNEDEKMLLQIIWKKIPANATTFDNLIGPLPHHWFDESDNDVCFIVRDPKPKEFLKDRELDLNETRELYTEKLLAAGFDNDFLKQRLAILPMRELVTEYKDIEAKSKLCAAYDVFLADHRLLSNKHKYLNSFLGYKFFVERKKIPIPIKIGKLEGEELKNEILNALKKTHLCVNGKGSDCTIQIGLLSQSLSELSANLKFILKSVNQLFGDNIALLKLKTPKSFAIPIFADLRSKNIIEVEKFFPKPKALHPIIDDFPLFNHTNVVINHKGDIRLKRRRDEPTEEEDKDEEFLNQLESKWVKITNPRRRKKAKVIDFSVFRKYRKPGQLNETKPIETA